MQFSLVQIESIPYRWLCNALNKIDHYPQNNNAVAYLTGKSFVSYTVSFYILAFYHIYIF